MKIVYNSDLEVRSAPVLAFGGGFANRVFNTRSTQLYFGLTAGLSLVDVVDKKAPNIDFALGVGFRTRRVDFAMIPIGLSTVVGRLHEDAEDPLYLWGSFGVGLSGKITQGKSKRGKQ